MKIVELGFWGKNVKVFSHLESKDSSSFLKILQVFYFLTLSKNYWVGFLKKKMSKCFSHLESLESCSFLRLLQAFIF